VLITVAHIGAKPAKSTAKAPFDALTRLYLDRIAPYISVSAQAFANEAAFLTWFSRQQGRVPAVPILLDSRGRLFSSTEFSQWIGVRRDQGSQHLVFAIGPADGWSAVARELATLQPALLLSFGPMTLPHELARVVLAEQIYRACTILAGHPYHSGH
jgi:23S rRNA (pseudouridine1915-N3)-methyltransferase